MFRASPFDLVRWGLGIIKGYLGDLEVDLLSQESWPATQTGGF